MVYVGFFILAALLVFCAVILIRTLRFTPKESAPQEICEEIFDKDKAILSLAELVKCKTVSRATHEEEDEAEFEKLYALLPKLFPRVHETCECLRFEDRGLLFRLRGKSEEKPSVLMAHFDVVPVCEEHWEKPPFDAVVEDGYLWGRGSLDTKVTLSAILSAADTLIAEGFVPENDIYFAFSGCEEVNGKGALHIVNYFKEKGIEPSMVVDEGGAVVEGVFPGVLKSCAMVGIAEKGMLNLKYKVTSNGGHASAPKPHTPVGLLSRACCRVENRPFPSHITKPVAEMFDTLGRHSTFVYRMIFANLWCFGWVLDLLAKKSGGDMNALMRTTVAFTQMTGSDAPNVIPPSAEMVSNIRLNPADTVEGAIAYLEKTVGDENVVFEMINGMNPSRVSTTDCDGYARVERAISATWQGCIVTPYLMVQCSDSRHYGAISDKVYRFSAMALTSEERATIHGNNERIPLETITKAVEFFLRLMRQC